MRLTYAKVFHVCLIYSALVFFNNFHWFCCVFLLLYSAIWHKSTLPFKAALLGNLQTFTHMYFEENKAVMKPTEINTNTFTWPPKIQLTFQKILIFVYMAIFLFCFCSHKFPGSRQQHADWKCLCLQFPRKSFTETKKGNRMTFFTRKPTYECPRPDQWRDTTFHFVHKSTQTKVLTAWALSVLLHNGRRRRL